MSRETFGSLTDPPAAFTVVGARVIDPVARTDQVRDLAVVDGLIAEEPDPGAERIDGRGLVAGARPVRPACPPPRAGRRGRRDGRKRRAGGGTRWIHHDLRDAEHRTATRLGIGGRPRVVRGGRLPGTGDRRRDDRPVRRGARRPGEHGGGRGGGLLRRRRLDPRRIHRSTGHGTARRARAAASSSTPRMRISPPTASCARA